MWLSRAFAAPSASAGRRRSLRRDCAARRPAGTPTATGNTTGTGRFEMENEGKTWQNMGKPRKNQGKRRRSGLLMAFQVALKTFLRRPQHVPTLGLDEVCVARAILRLRTHGSYVGGLLLGVRVGALHLDTSRTAAGTACSRSDMARLCTKARAENCMKSQKRAPGLVKLSGILGF